MAASRSGYGGVVAARNYTVVTHANAVPTGHYTTTARSADECAAVCDASPVCLQWSFNAHRNNDGKHHCFTGSSSQWQPLTNDHVTSGCLPHLVQGCPATPAPLPKRPYWTAPKPDDSKPLFGYKRLGNITDSILFRPETEVEGM